VEGIEDHIKRSSKILFLEKDKLKESKIIHDLEVSVEEHKMETKKHKADIEKQRLRWD
jgi:hypothetical protein